MLTRSELSAVQGGGGWYRGRDIYPQTPPAADDDVGDVPASALGATKRIGARIKNRLPA